MKGLGIFLLVFLLLLGNIFLFYACVHYHDFWSLFIYVPVILAFFSPAICFGYTPPDEQEYRMNNMYPETRRACIELGWAVAAVLLLGAYGIPVLAWYNGVSLEWLGVVQVFMALNCWVWSYVIWLRIFVFL